MKFVNLNKKILIIAGGTYTLVSRNYNDNAVLTAYASQMP